jgi:hypothetical protein
MKSTFTLLALASGLLLGALPSHAQFAYNHVATASTGEDEDESEKPTKPVATKLVHGVIQNQQGALAGATVWLHGTRTIVVTNAEGVFELRVPVSAKMVELTCGYGGLHDETVRLASAQSLGSIYLLRSKAVPTEATAAY